jgi:uncharacterized protein YbaP (TraB family)
MAKVMFGGKGMLVNSEGQDLWSMLDSQSASSLKEILARVNFPEEAAGLMRPWAVAFNLETMLLLSLGYSVELGIDQHFLEAAKRKGLKINQLESFEEQIDFFSTLPDELSLLFLKSVISEIDQLESGMDRLVAFWREGDDVGFAKLYFEIYEQNPSLRPILDVLVEGRNRTMAERLLQYFQSPSPSFAVVGCAHLVGPEGLPELFKRRGYKVTQL